MIKGIFRGLPGFARGFTLFTIASMVVGMMHASTTGKEDWRFWDAHNAYDGPLGAALLEDGSATLNLWSPMVHRVEVVLYDREDQDRVLQSGIPMEKGERGVWQVVLDARNTGLASLRGYYYHYRIWHTPEADSRLALDPYAKSMAPFSKDRYPIGKAAIVDPSRIGPENNFAVIAGFERRQDAVIWEIHVRDFTVDPEIETELQAPFGTFEAMIDRLDYVRELGVTHVQLLPVMSYFWGDELLSRQREMHYSSQGNNYNWGYDPHSYFSLSGMYSANPYDPESRIAEFKRLIAAIHERGMGVILDVVYNHTADLRVFEDLAPGYYHFSDADGTPRTSFGGGRLGTTHAMARRILIDSIVYWTDQFKVDGFRFDMMGDHDAETIQLAWDAAKAINPKVLMIGEGWRTFAGDEGDPRSPADQDWMAYTDSVAVFSDEFRNEVKSGYGNEGEMRFITGGGRSVRLLFDNIKAQPHNFLADDPGDVVPYIAAHDNLTLHDVIAYSIRKDPDLPENQSEIHRRIRLGNLLVLTSQGVAFLHAGQEYGRTKQWRAPGEPEHKWTRMVDAHGEPFQFPYFIHDSYDSSDAVNRFDWAKATDPVRHPGSVLTRSYTAGLIALRRSSDAFRLPSREAIEKQVTLLSVPEIRDEDLAIAYRLESSDGDRYYVFVNADSESRHFTLTEDLAGAEVIVDDDEAGVTPVQEPSGFAFSASGINLEPLTAVVLVQR